MSAPEPLHPATEILDDLTRSLPLIACLLIDASGCVRAASQGTGHALEGGVIAAAVEAALEAGAGLLRATGEARVDGLFVEGAGTHAFLRPFGEGVVVALFDPSHTTFGAVRMAVRRQTETLALLVQVEAPQEAIDRRVLKRFLSKL